MKRFIPVLLLIFPQQIFSQDTGNGQTSLLNETIIWGNKYEQVELLNDTAAIFRTDRTFHPGDDHRHGHRNRPCVWMGPSYYSFATAMNATYRFAHDTLILSFKDTPDLFLRIKEKKLLLLKNLSPPFCSKLPEDIPFKRCAKNSCNSTVVHTGWQNKSDRIVLENDSVCSFQMDRKKIHASNRFYRDKKGVTHLPHSAFYVYRTDRKALYSIRSDTVTITFITVPSDPSHNRLNRYRMGNVDLTYLPDRSFSPFEHKRRTFIKIAVCE